MKASTPRPDDDVLRDAFDAADGNITRAALILTSMLKAKVTRHMARHWYSTLKVEEVEEEDFYKPFASGIIASPSDLRGKLTGNGFVFTQAQNNTYVHKEFFASIMRFCERNNAELVVGTSTYNKTGFQNDTKDDKDLWYDPVIGPFICDRSMQVASSLVWSGELNILPTAVNPLSGLENYTQRDAMIVPHTKVRCISVPTMKHTRPKVMFTTGSITQRNYIKKKAGQKASHHHTFAALYVEVAEDGVWFARQLVASKDGCFNDLNVRYHPDGWEYESVLAINWGDLHVEKMDSMVAAYGMGIIKQNGRWTFAGTGNSLVELLNPEWQFAHDASDFSPRNHHNIKDHQFIFERHSHSTGNVEKALTDVGYFLLAMAAKARKVVVVKSNHDTALDTWLKTADYREDPENAIYFLKLQRWIYQALANGRPIDIFKEALQSLMHGMQKITFLSADESFILKGVEFGMHGHLGANGARGGPLALSKLGTKANTGHTHSPAIIDGLYVAGLSGLLEQGYNEGLSSWSQTHIITFKSGKRQLITMAPDGRHYA